MPTPPPSGEGLILEDGQVDLCAFHRLRQNTRVARLKA